MTTSTQFLGCGLCSFVFEEGTTSPLLIWLSNILFWKNGEGKREIYNLSSLNLNVIDMYYVEHVPSVIRRQTKVTK